MALFLFLWTVVTTGYCKTTYDGQRDSYHNRAINTYSQQLYYYDDLFHYNDNLNNNMDDLYYDDDDYYQLLEAQWEKLIPKFMRVDWTDVIRKIVNEIAKARKKDDFSGKSIKEPKKRKGDRSDWITKRMQVPEFYDELRIPKYDEDRGELPCDGLLGYIENGIALQDRILKFVTAGPHIPIRDRYIKDKPKTRLFSSREKAVKYIHRKYPTYPQPNIQYKEFTSDHSMSIFAFSGLGAHYMKRYKHYEDEEYEPEYEDDFEFVSDFSAISNIPVRGKYERYGATAYFDKDYKIKAIYWSHGKKMVFPKDEEWEHAKWAWKVSAIVYITAADHLTWTHFIDSNVLLYANVRRLPLGHILRIFIKPFTHNTANINVGAATLLVDEKGMLEHISAFDYREIQHLLDYAKWNYKFVNVYDKVIIYLCFYVILCFIH